MNTMDQLLHEAFDDLAAKAPHDEALSATIARRSRYRRAVTIAPLAAALAVLGVVGTIVLVRPPAVDPAASAPSACAPIRTAVLPTWARAGFSDPKPSMPFVTSTSGAMVAIVFADPLISPALPELGNKILWVTNEDASAGDSLHIAGRLEGGTSTMQATVDGGPGPSLINVPVAGCWQFDLSWGSHRDTIDIAYAKS
jgi:hypothetical protein